MNHYITQSTPADLKSTIAVCAGARDSVEAAVVRYLEG